MLLNSSSHGVARLGERRSECSSPAAARCAAPNACTARPYGSAHAACSACRPGIARLRAPRLRSRAHTPALMLLQPACAGRVSRAPAAALCRTTPAYQSAYANSSARTGDQAQATTRWSSRCCSARTARPARSRGTSKRLQPCTLHAAQILTAAHAAAVPCRACSWCPSALRACGSLAAHGRAACCHASTAAAAAAAAVAATTEGAVTGSFIIASVTEQPQRRSSAIRS